MIKTRRDKRISETIETIAQLNRHLGALLKEQNFFSRSPNFSQYGPTRSPKKTFAQTGVDSPLSLEALRAYQASRAFTPSCSPTEEGAEATSSVPFKEFKAQQARAGSGIRKPVAQRSCAAYSSIGPA